MEMGLSFVEKSGSSSAFVGELPRRICETPEFTYDMEGIAR